MGKPFAVATDDVITGSAIFRCQRQKDHARPSSDKVHALADLTSTNDIVTGHGKHRLERSVMRHAKQD